MEAFIYFTLCFLITLAIIQTFNFLSTRRRNRLKLPPGPFPLPIVGNLFDLGPKPHKSLAKLSTIHGPLISLKLGQLIAVVISSPDLAKQVLKTHDLTFSNRFVVQALEAHRHSQLSVGLLPVSPSWRNLRKICNSYIFSSQKLDASRCLRRKKVQQLIADVQQSCLVGEAVDIGQAVFRTLLDAMSNAIFSLDLSDSNSDVAREFKQIVRKFMDEVGKPNLADFFPILKKVDPQRIRHRMTFLFGKLLDLFDGIIDQRSKLRREEGYISSKDMLDTLLTIMEENNQETDINTIKHLFLDLFVAGTDTTSSTIEWAIAELLRNPKTLSTARKELEQKIGRGKLVDEWNITELPYLQAVIKETFRLHPAAPLLLPRRVGEDVEMCGFTIPKGAQVLVNVWAIGRDPNLWEDPESFFPERFLGSDMDVRGQNFELIPFGSGRRICPRMPLAIRMVYLVLGSLLNCFDWKLEDGLTPEDVDMDDKFGFTLQKTIPLRAVPCNV